MKHKGPLLGYNNNIPYKGQVYHVQTEDSGSRRPHIFTHLFADGGRIVKSRKTSYAKFLEVEDMPDRVRALMRSQHKDMVVSLRTGSFDHLLEPGAVPEVDKFEADPNDVDASTGGAGVVDDSEFYEEIERITRSAEAEAPQAAAAGDAKTDDAAREQSPGSYRYVGNSSKSAPPPGELGSTLPPFGASISGELRFDELVAAFMADRG